MNEKHGAYNSELFKMDLKIFENAMIKKDFKTANIMSNRIMSNAWISDAKFYGIIGFFLRQLSIEVLNSSRVDNDSAAKIILDQSSLFTTNVLGQVSSNKQNLKELWISFGIVMEKSRKSILLEDERNNYKMNIEYTSQTTEKVTQVLFASKNILTYRPNNLIKGVLEEILRTAKSFGINTSDLYILSVLTMIDCIDEYVRNTAIDKEDFEKRIEKEVIPYVNKLEELHNEKMEQEKTDNLLWDLIKTWRLYYVRFMDLRPQQQQQLTIEGKIKDELIDELADGLEKEMINE